MTAYKNVSGDTVDIPQFDIRVPAGDVIDVDADFSASPLFKAVKPTATDTEGKN